MADPDDDESLLRRAQRGDRDAFDDLVRRYHRAVWSYARRVLGDEDRAAEVAQDTFVRAWKYRASWKREAGLVRGWLFAVAANRLRDARRARRDEPAPLDDAAPVASGEAGGLEAFARDALREEVVRALESLHPDEREVLTLKYVSDLSFDDVAQALGISTSAAKMRALRARATLAAKLAKSVVDSGSGEVQR